MARKGLPKKYAAMGFKKGWKEYKKSLRSRGSGSTTTTKKKTMGKSTPKTKTKTIVKKVYVKSKPKTTKGSGTMKKKRAVSKKMGKPSRPRKRTLMMNRSFNALVKGGIAGLAALAGLFIVNKTPWIKDQKAWVKSLVQAGLGLIPVIFVKQPLMKIAGTGLISGGAISMAMPFMPEGLSFAGAGGGRTLTRDELYQMQQMGVPADIMGKPVDINEISTMGRGSGKRSGIRSRLASRY